MAEPRATLHSKEMEVSRKLSNAQGSFEPRQLVSARDNLHPPEHQRCLLPAMAMALDMAGGTAPAPCSSSRASISKSGGQKGHPECQVGVFRGLAQAEPGGYQLVGNAAVLFQTGRVIWSKVQRELGASGSPLPSSGEEKTESHRLLWPFPLHHWWGQMAEESQQNCEAITEIFSALK